MASSKHATRSALKLAAGVGVLVLLVWGGAHLLDARRDPAHTPVVQPPVVVLDPPITYQRYPEPAPLDEGRTVVPPRRPARKHTRSKRPIVGPTFRHMPQESR
jgi:hypothetical protein